MLAHPKRRLTPRFPSTCRKKQASASKTAPESARGRLKSCLSSRKRTRGGPGGGGGSAATPGDRTSPGSHDSPDVTAGADSVASGPLSPSARPPTAAAGGGGAVKTPGTAGGGGVRMTVPDIGMETPRRVMFGAPMAAEFNHTSPSNRLTPMPSRDAKVMT